MRLQNATERKRCLLWGTFLLMILACRLEPHAEVPLAIGRDDEVQLPLPRWTEEEIRLFRSQVSVPANNDVPLQGRDRPTANFNDLIRPLAKNPPDFSPDFKLDEGDISPRLRPEDMGLFLPDSLLRRAEQNRTVPRPHGPVAFAVLRDVTAGFLAACTHSLPQEYLIDPDVLVPEMQHQDMMRFLEFHSRESQIKLYILVISRDSKLPGGADLNKIASGSLLKANSCLLVYPLGEPWRARLFVSQPVHHNTSHAFLSETAQACLSEALLSSDEFDQLHRYALQLSTRLFWMQRALPANGITASAESQILAEVAPHSPDSIPRPTRLTSMWTGALTACLVLMFSGIAWHRLRAFMKRRHQETIWILPEPETLPRLGGAFTGGGGGMIKF